MISIGIFGNVNALLTFFFCVLYSLSFFGWSFIIVAFLPTQRSSGIAAVLIAILTNSMSALLMDPSTSANMQYGLSILPNVCLGQILKQIFFYNYQTAEGLTFNTTNLIFEGYSFSYGMLIMLADVIIFGLLGVYLDQVIPSKYGVAKPWNFCCKCKKSRHNMFASSQQRLIDESEWGPDKKEDNFEAVPDSLKKQERDNQCLKVRGLVKKFGEKTAVNGTSLTMYSGQIFALLGHNGAGKTTTISMLTGLIPPTAG